MAISLVAVSSISYSLTGKGMFAMISCCVCVFELALCRVGHCCPLASHRSTCVPTSQPNAKLGQLDAVCVSRKRRSWMYINTCEEEGSRSPIGSLELTGLIRALLSLLVDSTEKASYGPRASGTGCCFSTRRFVLCWLLCSSGVKGASCKGIELMRFEKFMELHYCMTKFHI